MAILNKATSPGALKVYLNLSLHYSRDKLSAWPSAQTITKETGLSHGPVWNALKWLEENGLIKRRRYMGHEHASVVVWDLPHRTDMELRALSSGSRVETVKQHWIDVLTDLNPAVKDKINEGHLAKIMKDYSDLHGIDLLYRSVDVWVGMQAYGFDTALGEDDYPDPVATYRSWLDFEGIKMTKSRTGSAKGKTRAERREKRQAAMREAVNDTGVA